MHLSERCDEILRLIDEALIAVGRDGDGHRAVPTASAAATVRPRSSDGPGDPRRRPAQTAGPVVARTGPRVRRALVGADPDPPQS